jgi:DNA-binding LytR/AlgR family response regulator
MQLYFKKTSLGKQLLIVKKGENYLTIRTENVVCIYVASDTTFVIAQDGKKYLSNDSLNVLQTQLSSEFYRASRQYIINVNFVISFRGEKHGKLTVEIGSAGYSSTILLSRASATKFKKWIDSL